MDDIGAAAEIFGRHDQNLALLEKALGIKMVTRGEELLIMGPREQVQAARDVIDQLQEFYRAGNRLTTHEINYTIDAVKAGQTAVLTGLAKEVVLVTPRGKKIKPKTAGQHEYIAALQKNDIV